ncbi:hypothetical protein V5P93_000892 [Actinokineospora auranticolor]|uniref:Uncharacterized protein n=1 Tax=Actinokineospora auranticolor TaxID=155976 RepID=A0A2S6GYJ9_9PSEU|nr:hypothetical protein [Actinokineospora auranticolor]PPK70231.1 hypothetical protein CLV40_102142 [Actinokineospora auranticolor]
MNDSDAPQRGRKYYLIVCPLLLVATVVGILLIERAPWLLILSGTFLGGFIVEGFVDWKRHRRR